MNSREFDGPTCGAVRAAKIIMGGDKAMNTTFGRKSVLGVADIIDRESGLRDLLVALEEARAVLETAKRYFPKSIKNRDEFSRLNVLANAVAPAIAKCLPRG